MSYARPMSDMPPPPPPPGQGQQGYGAQGGADVWGDDTNGRAGFGNRLGNYLLDALLYGVAMLIPMYIGAFMVASSLFDCDFFFTDLAECSGETDATRFVGGVALGTLGPLLVMIGYVVQLGRTGQTWGRRIVSNKVIRVDNGDVPGIGRALGRELFAWIVSASILYLGYLWMIWDDDRQTWHDKVAGTSVVRSR